MAAFDVAAAFLEGKPDCRLFARLLKCISDGERVEIAGNWYGLKQGPKIWNDQLNAILLQLEFIRCPVHPCFYRRTRDEFIIIKGVHVDDGLLGCNVDSELDIFVAEFERHVRKATVTRDLRKYTGISVTYKQSERVIELSHTVYIDAKYPDPREAEKIPISATANLRTAAPNPLNPSLLPDTGTLRIIANRARPEILVAVGELSTGGAESPSDLHMTTSERI
jgi:hypothetical protein